ncbi:hypothetical protein BTN49_1723 [Candidatus Enterovibrio escicola]|uniref:Uncharacterized protein n=1 Tax=Candidatus Enterovibrio escicola TaxID=1927127 RepID=A0A2A5T3L8_9GAMM|nr:hypothetical protein BTN49_1723 [Candidatus Enterovibrio escacola]
MTIICHNRMDMLLSGISKSIINAVTSAADFDTIFIINLNCP